MKQWEKRPGGAKGLFAMVMLLGVVAVALFLVLRGNGGASGAGGSEPRSAPSSAERFGVLSAAHSNRCDLGARQVHAMSDQRRLRGSCCFPMDQSSYRSQLRGLRRYAGNRFVPPNPYDVRARLAKRLLAYRHVALTTGQEAIYRRASKKSETGGPCCCPCWRWQAFKGQARFLITRRHYSADRLARLWGLEEGCGGPTGS